MTHEARLREIAAIRQSVEHGRAGEAWVPEHAAYTVSILVGAAALRIALEGIARYTADGGCSNCGWVPHTTTCMIGQFAALLATETTR